MSSVGRITVIIITAQKLVFQNEGGSLQLHLGGAFILCMGLRETCSFVTRSCLESWCRLEDGTSNWY